MIFKLLYSYHGWLLLEKLGSIEGGIKKGIQKDLHGKGSSSLSTAVLGGKEAYTLVAAETCLGSSQSVSVCRYTQEWGWLWSTWVAWKCICCGKCVCIAFASGFFQDTFPQKRQELQSRRMMVLVCYKQTKDTSAPGRHCWFSDSAIFCIQLCSACTGFVSAVKYRNVLGYVIVILCLHGKDPCRKKFTSRWEV